MELSYIFLISISTTVLCILLTHAWKRRAVAGAGAFIAQVLFVLIWSLGACLELLAADMHGMIFWRNVQQIGAFGLPIACIWFAVQYGRYAAWRKYLPLFCILPAVALALIFTDQTHHLMRAGYSVNANAFFGKALSVKSTPLNLLTVAYNFCLVAISVVLLGIYASKAEKHLRGQAILIIVSFTLVYIFAFIKMAFLDTKGGSIPVAAIFLPNSLILFYNLFWHRMFLMSPLARDKVFDVIEQGIIVTGNTGTVVDRNPFAMYLMRACFGIHVELSGKSISEIFPQYPNWVKFVTDNSVGELEIQIADCEQQERFIRIKVYPLQSDNDVSLGTVSIIRDITARRLQEFALKSKADMDGLTALLNRSGFIEASNRMLDDARIDGYPVSILMMDLDKFKTINDNYGHSSGDKALVFFSYLFQSVLRQNDAIGRIGGDEFAAVLPGVNSSEALGIAERIREKANSLSITMENGENVYISLSIGICDNAGADICASGLLNLADKAMYRAKNLSRNCCVVWE